MTTELPLSVAAAWERLELPRETTSNALGRIHLVGIGGIGMSGIAEVLLTLGYNVTGSDLQESEATRRLRTLGAEVWTGHHDAERVTSDTEVVVVSSAVDDANAEVRAARRLRIPVIRRAEMLAELMRVKCGVAVAGAHGKTTTTSLVAEVLGKGGYDPTIVIGGRLRSLGGTNVRLGRSRYMVAEADESDGSFLLLRPTMAIVTNIDREHLAHYGSLEKLVDAYVTFIESVPFYGRAILCIDCNAVRALLPRIRKRYTTYGLSEDADVCAVSVRARGTSVSFDVVEEGRRLGPVRVNMPGRHTVQNTLAALAAGIAFGVPFETCAEAVAGFQGILRRFETKGETRGVLVVDDYGHHPTEIRATLAAAREAFANRRLVAVFQPHRYSRTADLFHEFAGAFSDAAVVVVTDVYAAGEPEIEGVTGATLCDAMARRHAGTVAYCPRCAELPEFVANLVRSGDVVVTLGAGDITAVGPEILAALGA